MKHEFYKYIFCRYSIWKRVHYEEGSYTAYGVLLQGTKIYISYNWLMLLILKCEQI